jgi:hypothetical protein
MLAVTTLPKASVESGAADATDDTVRRVEVVQVPLPYPLPG